MKNDPLKQLVKSSEEIADMKAKGLLSGTLVKNFLRKDFGSGQGLFAVRNGKHLVHKRFRTLNIAKAWGYWNYKGDKGWEVVRLVPVTIFDPAVQSK
jgi:hypothetical protein